MTLANATSHIPCSTRGLDRSPLILDTISKAQSRLLGLNRNELYKLILEISLQRESVCEMILNATSETIGKSIEHPTMDALQYTLELTAGKESDGSEHDITSRLEKLKSWIKYLSESGKSDEVLLIGEALVRNGPRIATEITNSSKDISALRQCMQLALASLPNCSMTPNLKLSWFMSIFLEDDAKIISSEDIEALLSCSSISPKNLEIAATLLENRLTLKSSTNQTTNSRRHRILNLLIKVYKKADMDEKIIPLLESEVSKSQCYLLLAEALLERGDQKGAQECCIIGFRSVQKKSPELAKRLRDRWCDLNLHEGLVFKVAACRAQAYFDDPTVDHYKNLREASIRARCWPAVRLAVLNYLQTGIRPDDKYGPTSSKWPLPESEFKLLQYSARNNPLKQFPDKKKLIEIAILENRMEDIASLYREAKPLNQIGGFGADVAQALSSSHPQVAIEILSNLANSRLFEARPKHHDKNFKEAISNLWQALNIAHTHSLIQIWISSYDALLSKYAYRPKLQRMLKQEADNALMTLETGAN